MLRLERLPDRFCPALAGLSDALNVHLSSLGFTNPGLTFADFTGDGHPEYCVYGDTGDGARLLVLDGKPQSVPPGSPAAPEVGLPETLYDGLVPGFSIDWRGGLDVVGLVNSFGFGPKPPDRLAVAADAGGGPVVTVYTFDGTGFDTHTFFALDENFRGGVNLDSADVGGDGTADLVATPGLGGGPLLYFYDADGKSLRDPLLIGPADDRSGLYHLAPAGYAPPLAIIDRGTEFFGVIDLETGLFVDDPNPFPPAAAN